MVGRVKKAGPNLRITTNKKTEGVFISPLSWKMIVIRCCKREDGQE